MPRNSRGEPRVEDPRSTPGPKLLVVCVIDELAGPGRSLRAVVCAQLAWLVDQADAAART